MTPTPSNTPGIPLRELLRNADFYGAENILVSACCGDSRVCSPGDLFVAMMGPHQDGHDFVAEAVANGATAILAERLLPMAGVPVVVVPDARWAYGRICQALAGDPSHSLKVIGVSGTNGKTSVACLIAAMLEAAGDAVGMLNSLGYCDGREFEPSLWPTPPPPVLAHWLARMRDNGCSYAIVEVSSEALLHGTLAGVELNSACLTNVRRGDLAAHGSITNYQAAKARLFEHLAKDGAAILNIDDPVVEGLLVNLRNPTLTVSLHEDAEITATLLERSRSEQTFLLSAGSDSTPVRTSIVGDSHITNCLLAAAIGLAYGLDLPTVVRGLEGVKKIPSRLERIECGQPFGVFVDEAATPDRLANALITLREVTPGRLICVASLGYECQPSEQLEMSRAVEKMANVVIATGELTRDPAMRGNLARLLRGFSTPQTVQIVADRELAIRWALNEAQPGDCVLITGDRRGIGRMFAGADSDTSDRHIAQQWLYDRGSLLGTRMAS